MLKPQLSLPNIQTDIDFFASLQKNTFVFISTRMTLGIIILSLSVLLFFWNSLPPEVPMWYSRPWGLDRLAHPSWLFLLPGASFLWFCVNTILSIRITKDHLVFSQILFLSSLLVSMFSFVTLSMIIWIIN